MDPPTGSNFGHFWKMVIFHFTGQINILDRKKGLSRLGIFKREVPRGSKIKLFGQNGPKGLFLPKLSKS